MSRRWISGFLRINVACQRFCIKGIAAGSLRGHRLARGHASPDRHPGSLDRQDGEGRRPGGAGADTGKRTPGRKRVCMSLARLHVLRPGRRTCLAPERSRRACSTSSLSAWPLDPDTADRTRADAPRRRRRNSSGRERAMVGRRRDGLSARWMAGRQPEALSRAGWTAACRHRQEPPGNEANRGNPRL